MNKRNIEAIYPLSPMQQGMLFHYIYAPESGVYFEQMTCTLEGELNVPAFKHAWQQVVDRHPILRTSFVWKRLDKTLQIVHRHVMLPFEELDWSDIPSSEQETCLEQYLKQNQQQGFNLSEPPLLRLAIIRLSENSYQFVWNHHHLLLDGWSLPLVIKEVFSFYEALRQDKEINLALSRPYRDYIAWLQKQDVSKAEKFWRETLKGFKAPTPLIVDQISNGVSDQDKLYDNKKVYISKETTTALNSLARQYQLTLNTMVQGAWSILLNRYSSEEDIVFGSTVSGRPTEIDGVESMIGLFINTLPVRINVQPEASIISWLQHIQKQQIEVRQYQYSPLVDIQGWSDVPRDMPLFDSILVFENYPVDSSFDGKNGSLAVKNIRFIEQTNYPITVVASPGEELFLEIVYDLRRFNDSSIMRMLNHLHNLLQDFTIDPEQKIRNLQLLSGDEQKQLIIGLNDRNYDYPFDTCAHLLFENQVEQNPDALALVFESEQLTYQELNQRANQLAYYLQKIGVGPEVLVGICTERSIEMIVAMLGIIKAGGAFVPLDPRYPKERLAFMLKDSKTKVLLTQQAIVESFAEITAKTICLDTEWENIVAESSENPVNKVLPDNLAYVIYTSGSTGTPKGTMLQHRGLCNLAFAQRRILGVGTGSRILQFASISFDASVWEVVLALLNGGTLILAKQDVLLSSEELAKVLQQQHITDVTLPPSMLTILQNDNLPALTTVISAGESCTKEIAMRWSRDRNFFNGYGPTETTVAASLHKVENLSDNKSVPIGRPYDNTQLYVMDEHLNLVPLGVAGELYIGSVALARGYLDRPDLTAERFIPNSFDGKPGARLYKTGDLVRYLPDGNLDFLGRIDHQVKVRGFRIELGEIEAILNQHLAIQTAVVLAREDKPGDRRLVAYYVIDEKVAHEPTASELYDFLKQSVPDYMTPSIFMKLDQLPLTPNGKVDRKALPVPEHGRPELGRAYVAPRTPTEELLAGIMTTVLGVEKVGIHDSFFELGGHSLLGIKVQSRIRDTFQIELPLQKIFEAPTVVELANEVEITKLSEKGIEAPPIEPISRAQDLPLSFAQQRLWFLDQLEPNSPFYNIPTALRLIGKLNIEVLQQSINEIIRRHESLRTSFKSVKGKPYQVISSELKVELKKLDLSDFDEIRQEEMVQKLATEDAQKPFDLSQEPLFRMTLIKLADEHHIILLNMHHIISDGWSVAVLTKELAALYEAYSEGKPSPLPELTIQYADFAHWQQHWLEGEVLEAQLAYWKERLSGSPPLLELSTDRPRPAVQSFKGANLARQFSGELLKSLKTLSQNQGVTLFMTFLAALKTLLYRYSGQTDINVGTPHANRNQLETEHLIGFFVNTLVMRTDFSTKPTFTELLKQVRDVTFGAYAHQDMPFEMLVEAVQPQRDLSHTPLFQVMLVVQNVPIEKIELPGLTISPLKTESGTAKFDLSLIISEQEHGFNASFEYNTNLFNESTIKRMMDHFGILLQNIVANSEQKVATIPIMSEQELQEMLVERNTTEAKFPSHLCMHQWFELLVEQNPDALALTFVGQELSYSEFNRQANQMARYLQKIGIGEEDLVGICMDRSLEMMVGIMGTLKAGGAFIPLDPAYPPDRLDYMITDSSISVLLTQQALVERINPHQAKLVCVDSEWKQISEEPDRNLNLDIDPANLAYVIYTSGSTGKPKGTMLQHRGWCNLGRAQQIAFGLSQGTRVLQFSALSFDASVWEIVMALLSGATLCLTNREMLETGQGLLKVLEDDEITTVTLPPSVLAVVPEAQLPNLKTIITAGEACSADLVSRWGNGRQFFNAYGPTETTVCASMFLAPKSYKKNPPIGRPIANFQLYVLDANLQPVAKGVPGELGIGGIGLARGYLNRPDLTAEKFIPDPFSKKQGGRLYRSGDLVRYLPDGNIEFLGRIDHQVKVRGFRIELGEIEAVLKDHSDILDAAAIVREDKPGDKRIVTYLIADAEQDLTVGELRSYLRERLPDYMVPSIFMILQEFPLSPSGKVDRNQLPAPDLSRPELGSEFVAPRNEIEEKLATICAELLNLEKVGVYDNFFELGGHSLLATQFISHIRDEFQIELSLRTLFEFPTIADLAMKVIESPKISEQERIPIEKEERGGKTIEELLVELDQLTDEEAEVLLENEKGN